MSEQTSSTPTIGEAQIELLERLSNVCAVSGEEGPVRAIVLEAIRPFADEIQVDTMGNVLATRYGRGPERLRVMLAAHMDEVGLMITADEGEGYFRAGAIGGLDARNLAGKPVWVGRERTPGLIGMIPVHLSHGEINNRPSLDSLRVDVGPAAAGKIQLGDRATFVSSFQLLGPSLCGKALDDRLGVATLIELFRHAPDNVDLLAAFTAQEEAGLRGARVAAYALNPDLAFALDCTPARDFPGLDGEEDARYNTRLGAGPALYVADRGTLSDPRLIRLMVDTAEAEGIPLQLRQPGGGRTDASAIHTQRLGIPSLSLSVPGRYLHSPASIARRSDWEHSLALVYGVLRRLTPDILHSER